MKKLIWITSYVSILVIVSIFIFCSTGMAYKDRYTVRSRFPSSMSQPGTFLNPYEVKNNYGQTVGTIQTRVFDPVPGDGILEPGSCLNPYEVKTRR